MTTTKKILGTLFFLTMFFFIYLSNRDVHKKSEAISENKRSTIAKVYKIESGRNYTYAHFFYFLDKKKYYSSEFITNDMRTVINRYYRVDLSSVEPKYSQIHFDQEVTDPAEIVNAGFN